MNFVKNLLLGSGAALVAVAGAHATDRPVRAGPVEYVKICSIYGAGYYDIPGTDICIKIGGFVRAQYYSGTTDASQTPFFSEPEENQNTRLGGLDSGNDFNMRGRAEISVDTRSPTEWGTVRTYWRFGFTTQTPAGIVDSLGKSPSLYTRRAFIQWAGFTFGRALSFFDLFRVASSFSFFSVLNHHHDRGTLLASYTMDWGNGVSTTISVEEARRHAVVNTDALAAATVPLGNINNDAVQKRHPDVVANFRIDEAWGKFQLAGALHDASAAYYSFDPATTACNLNAVGIGAPTTITGAMNCGYPGDKWGWAASVAAIINLSFIAKGDRFAFQVNYSEGAYRYVANINGVDSNPSWFGGADSLGIGWGSDAVLRDNIPGVQSGSLELTKALGFIAAYEHRWTPYLRTSWYGGGYKTDYNANATTYLCQKFALSGTPVGAPAVNSPLCDPNFDVWFVGTRTRWDVAPDFYMGVDVLYQNLQTAHDGAFGFLAANGARPASPPLYQFEDQNALAITFRVQRSFVR